MKIAVGGMIASGKSTLLEELSVEYSDYTSFVEFRKDDKVFDGLLKWLYEGEEDVAMLVQLYFLHKHWKTQKENADLKNMILDRHIIEHWLFANENLMGHPEVLQMYNSLFQTFIRELPKPDLYLVLDVSWEDFKQRIMARGRPQEIENFERNQEYFSGLLQKYVDKLVAQCTIYDIPYYVIDTSGKSPKEVLIEAKGAIESHERYI